MSGLGGAVRRVAARAPVPVFVLQGLESGPPGDAELLRLDPRVEIVDSPRHATVLLVAGALPDELHAPAALVHDALPHPRATVAWGGDGATGVPPSLHADAVDGDDDVADRISALHATLLAGTRPSDPPALEATSRAPWHGVGPYGHGGTGMTGGTPYGRPLADRADDLRDGLKLDALPLTVGPFFPAFPPGLTLDVVLQGDVVQRAEVRDNPFAGQRAAAPSRDDPFVRAATEPVLVAALERVRAAHHLRRVAATLRLLGLAAMAERVLRLTAAPDELTVRDATAVLRLVARAAVERALPPAGRVDGEVTSGLGLVARAAGVPTDARTHDAVYGELGFAVITGEGGDARARWRQRLAELRQAVELAERAGARMREPGAPLEHPAPPPAALLAVLPRLLVGLEWGDAVAVVASLDLDLRRHVPTRFEAAA